jgi:hypothetical protein
MKFFAVNILILIPALTCSQLLNDECIGAVVIPSNMALPYTNIIPNFENATANSIDPIPSCNPSSDGIASVWYHWEPSSTALVDFSSIGESQTVNDFSDFFPTIAIYEGDCSDLRELACSAYLYLPDFTATAGKKYFIALFDYIYGDSMALTFVVSKTPPIPPSDECVNGLVIPSNISFPFSTPPVQISSATENPNDPVSVCTESSTFPTSAPFVFPTSAPFVFPTSAPFVFPTSTPVAVIPATIETVWYTWIPQVSGLYDLRTDKSTAAFGLSSVRTAIEIYRGNSCDSLTEVDCTGFRQSLRGAKLDAGIKYFIKAVTEFGDFGTSLTVTLNPTLTSPPVNDDCINATTINPLEGDIILGDTFYATSDDIDLTNSLCYAFDTPGLWYKFEVPKSMLIDVSTCNIGTTYDTSIVILSGDKCGEVKCITSNDDGRGRGCRLSSNLSFLASASTTYYVLVQGFGNDSGSFALTVKASVDYFALIDSETDKFIQPIENGDFFGYFSIPSKKLNIQTSFNDTVKSAMLTFDNPRRSVCETNAPFAVFGNDNSDYFGVTIPIGPHTVTATPYNRANCKGPAGKKISKSFQLYGCSFYYNYYDFTSNSTEPFYDDVQIPACNINIEVVPFCGFDIEFVELKIRNTKTNRIVQTKKEVDTPYFVFGNRGEVINQGSLKPGNYTIELNIDGLQHASTPFTAIDNGSCK